MHEDLQKKASDQLSNPGSNLLPVFRRPICDHRRVGESEKASLCQRTPVCNVPQGVQVGPQQSPSQTETGILDACEQCFAAPRPYWQTFAMKIASAAQALTKAVQPARRVFCIHAGQKNAPVSSGDSLGARQ